MLSHCICGYTLDGYTENDSKAAPALKIEPKDLVLRDRGYFALTEITRILEAGAYFIYRYKHGVKYCDVQTGEPHDLLKMLSKSQITDIPVKLGGPNGSIVRLIATPVSQEVADRRRAQLKKDSHNPSKEVLDLLSWSIFITNIEASDMNTKEVYVLYSFRWRVEIMFKALKSYLNLDSIHNVSEKQLRFMVMGKMLLFVLITNLVYATLCRTIRQHYNKDLSILKLTQYLSANFPMFTEIVRELKTLPNGKKQVLKILSLYCCYDKRKKRSNQMEIFMSCLS